MATYYNALSGGVATSGGSSSGVANFENYRTFSNKVQGRLTDVTFASGYVFGLFQLQLQLISSSGSVAASASLVKYWGVMGAWTTMTVALPPSSLRVRFNGTYYQTANVGGQWVTITFDLRFGSDI